MRICESWEAVAKKSWSGDVTIATIGEVCCVKCAIMVTFCGDEDLGRTARFL